MLRSVETMQEVHLVYSECRHCDGRHVYPVRMGVLARYMGGNSGSESKSEDRKDEGSADGMMTAAATAAIYHGLKRATTDAVVR